MSGHEFIKIYDGLLPPDIPFIEEVSALPAGSSLAGLPEWDNLFFRCVGAAIKLYSREFDYFTKLNSIQIGDNGYRVVAVNSLLGYDDGVGIDCLARVVMFLDEDSELDFESHGITIKAQKGRMVMFPSHWTHPFKGFGHGKVIETFITYAQGA